MGDVEGKKSNVRFIAGFPETTSLRMGMPSLSNISCFIRAIPFANRRTFEVRLLVPL